MNSLLDSVGEGEGRMIWEKGIETCELSYVKQIASPGSMHETGCSGLVHWDDPEGWDGKGGGRGSGWGTHVHSWQIQVNVWQKPILRIGRGINNKAMAGKHSFQRHREGNITKNRTTLCFFKSPPWEYPVPSNPASLKLCSQRY